MTQRRARNSDGTQFEPMTLGDMRALGVRSIEAICGETLCQHAATLDAASLPNALPVPDVALRMRCGRCGSRNVSTRPAWIEYLAQGSALRQ